MPDPIPLRNNRPLISDIPGQLRRLADDIANGVHETPEYVMVVWPDENAWPAVFLYGEHPGTKVLMADLDMLKTRLGELAAGRE